MKKILSVVAVFAGGILGTSAAHADGSLKDLNISGEVGSATQQVVQKAKEHYGWDWLKRTDISLETMEFRKPTWSLETIQPIYQTPNTLRNTYFFQGRGAYRNLDTTINLGLGYRHLLENQNWLLGVNGFYDTTTRYTHQRLGAGAEAIGKYVTFRTNYYKAISNKKTISVVGETTNYEQALSGYDAEIDAPVPFLPWIRVAANIFRFKHVTAGIDDITGNTLIVRSNLTKYLSLEFGRQNDTQMSSQKFIKITLNLLGTPTNGVQGTMTDGAFSSKAFQGRDLIEHTLDKVQRHNDIVVEKTSTSSSSGGGITIGRRN